jgi:hypothetical protein
MDRPFFPRLVPDETQVSIDQFIEEIKSHRKGRIDFGFAGKILFDLI